MKTLLLAYGNTLRRDDGAAHAVVQRLLLGPMLEVHDCRQLLPEHAELLTRGQQVIFVDAAVGIQAVTPQRIQGDGSLPSLNHSCDPAWLLALADTLYEHRPIAWMVSIPAHDLDLGEGLSPGTDRAIDEAVAWIEKLCTNSG